MSQGSKKILEKKKKGKEEFRKENVHDRLYKENMNSFTKGMHNIIQKSMETSQQLPRSSRLGERKGNGSETAQSLYQDAFERQNRKKMSSIRMKSSMGRERSTEFGGEKLISDYSNKLIERKIKVDFNRAIE